MRIIRIDSAKNAHGSIGIIKFSSLDKQHKAKAGFLNAHPLRVWEPNDWSMRLDP